MAKVYIVSSGSYSDYNIRKIFLSKEKAEAYHKVCDDCDLNDIEVYDTSDDEIIVPITYCRCEYMVFDCNQYGYYKLQGEYKFEINYSNTNEDTEESLIRTSYYNGKITLQRVIKNSFDKKQLKEKYLKVCQDLAAFIRNEISVNGASDCEIKSLLKMKEENK